MYSRERMISGKGIRAAARTGREIKPGKAAIGFVDNRDLSPVFRCIQGRERKNAPNFTAQAHTAGGYGSVVQRLVRVDDLNVTHTGITNSATDPNHSFDIRADLKHGSDDHWDFRQEVRGYAMVNGVEQTPLPSTGSGLAIKREEWVDDGYDKTDDVNPNPLIFETDDNPGFNGFAANDEVTYYLLFRARVIDTKDDKVIKEKSRYWIKIHGQHPRKFSKGGFD